MIHIMSEEELAATEQSDMDTGDLYLVFRQGRFTALMPIPEVERALYAGKVMMADPERRMMDELTTFEVIRHYISQVNSRRQAAPVVSVLFDPLQAKEQQHAATAPRPAPPA